MLPRITMEGRLTAEPDLRFIPSGKAVSNFTIAANDVRRNEAGEWEDVGDPLFVRVNVWGKQAEHVASSLTKSDLVVVVGRLSNRKYETKEGETRYSLEITADTVGVSLLFRSTPHSSDSRAQATSAQPTDDPWAGAGGQSDEPPF
jgi:single-strand DNA-binding protein